MLKGFARDSFPLSRAESISKRDLEIAERDFAAVPIHDRHQCANRQGEPITRSARQERNEFRRDEESDPLKSISDSLPNRTHGRSVTCFTSTAND
jgi:hypothetical protein